MSNRDAHTIQLGTTLSPLAHGTLAVLSAREDPARAAANTVLTRLLREELDKLLPGAWDRASQMLRNESGLAHALPPKEQSAAVADMIRAALVGGAR